MSELNTGLISFICALVGAGTYTVLSGLISRRLSLTGAAVVGFITWLIASFTLYFIMPTFQGSLFGLWSMAFVSLVPATVAVCLTGQEGDGASIKLSTVAFLAVMLLGVPVLQRMANTWGPTNSQKYGDLANLRVAGQEETIPPTDQNRIVKVDSQIAAFKGQTALTSTAQNLSSRYKVDPNNYVLQAVKGHRYWIAPLELVNFNDATWTPLFGGDSETPGYVVVDAQDPDAKATVHLGFHITRFPDGDFRMNLYRQLYMAGYNNGILETAKFEVDDEWQPHWVVSFSRYQFGDVGGKKVEKILVVDVATANATIKAYDAGSQPDWIERTMPQDLVEQYLDNWGMYNNEFAHQNPWKVWFGVSKIQSLKTTEFDLNYTTDNQSVYVVPMTSINGTDHAVTGIVVFDTNKNAGVYYPGVRGFNTSETVKQTIAHAPVFLGKNLDVDQVQLYSIYGELTWVGIITNPQSVGRGFAGVTLLHAMDQNASEVVFAADMDTALAQYRNQLARRSGNGANAVAGGSESKTLSGKVLGIGVVPGNTQQPNVWVFMVEGDSRTFAVTRDTYAKIPMVKEGDTVKITYLDIEAREVSVSSIHSLRLDGAAAPDGNKAK